MSSVRTWFHSERVVAVCGRRRRRRQVGGIALLVLVLLVLAGAWLPPYLATGEALWHSVGALDRVVTAGILAVAASIVLGFLYAAWNGGPLLSFALPVVPGVAGKFSSGIWAVNQDLAVVLSAGAGAAVLGVYSAGRIERAAVRPLPYDGVVDDLTVATTAMVLALGVLLQLRGIVGPHAAGAVRVAWLLWLVAALAGLAAWVGCLRASATGTTPGLVRSEPDSASDA